MHKSFLFLGIIAVIACFKVIYAAEPVHGIAMHNSLKYKAGFSHFDYVNPNALKGGKVTLGTTGSFDSFNAFIVKGTVAAGIGNIYDTLGVSAADEPFSIYGLLVENMEVPKDRSWAILSLRKEARWHDGIPVTADDVLFSFNVLRKKGQPLYRAYYSGIEKIEKLSKHRIKFTFSSSMNRELPLIIGQLPILPQHYWQSRDFSKTTLEPPLGSGPYRIKSAEPGRYVLYERVKNYWGRNLPVNKGKFNYNEIRYEYYRDQTVLLEAFKAGAFDFHRERTSKNWAVAYDVPAVKEGFIIKKLSHHNRPVGMQALIFNIRRAKFSDRRVRWALAHAFDFEWSNKNLFHGQHIRTRSFFENSELAAVGLPSTQELKILEKYRGQIPKEVFTTQYNPPATKGDGRIRANLYTALQLLKEAGWVLKKRRLTHVKTGKMMEIEFLIVSPLLERFVLPFIKNLERIGIKGRLRIVDQAQYIKRLNTFDFDSVVFYFPQTESPGNEQRTFWGSAAADINGSYNFIGIKNPVIDELIELVIAAPDRKQLITRVQALDRILQWNHYVVPLWYVNYDRIAYWNKFSQPKITPLQGFQFNSWWIDPKKEKALSEKYRK